MTLRQFTNRLQKMHDTIQDLKKRMKALEDTEKRREKMYGKARKELRKINKEYHKLKIN